MTRPPTAESPVRILVVGDDVRVRSAIAQTLDLERDLELVGEASEAETALALLSSCTSFVVVVDVLAPDDRNGLELLGCLSRLPQCAVVALSVRSAVRPAALAAGAAAFIDMGDDIDALLHAIRSASPHR